MSTTSADPLLETLVNDFGGNYEFALDVLDQYRNDRRSVDPSWRDYFDRTLGVPPEPEPPTGNGREAAATAAAATTNVTTASAVVRSAPATPAPAEKSKAVVLPAILPGDIAQPIRGGALRIVENMEASLQVPTATSMRTIPVRTLEENRRILNKHRESLGRRQGELHAPRGLGDPARASTRSRA